MFIVKNKQTKSQICHKKSYSPCLHSFPGTCKAVTFKIGGSKKCIKKIYLNVVHLIFAESIV